jgi:signal transduction histidine kinase
MPADLMAKFDYDRPVRWFPIERLVFSTLQDRMREEGVREVICISLMTQKKVLGLLYVTNDGALRLKHARTEFLKVIGHQLGVSIENVLLFDSVERARSELEITFDAIQHSIFLVDKRMRIYRVNKTCELVYRDQAPLLGQKYTRVLYGQDQPHPECPVWACLWGGQPVQREGPHPRWGGYYRYYAFPVFGSGGLHRVVYYEKDETESRRLENRLQQTERLKALGTLAAGIAHEIRNPLATINFNTQLLQRELNLDSYQAQMFEDTIQEVRKIDKIVQQVLRFARPAEPQFLPDRLNDVVRHCHDLARVNLRNADVEVVLDLEEGLPDLVMDFNQISQVVMNVILNGIDAMSGSGRLTIRTSRREDPPGVILRVSDTGPGILPEDRERIFDPFYTRKSEGTGLGLSISSQILEKHGAYIEIEDSSPLGTTFKIVFPMQ